MAKVSVRTGHTCLQGKHGPSMSDQARFIVRPACACNATVYACRVHLGRAVTEIAPGCRHMRFGEVIVRLLLSE